MSLLPGHLAAGVLPGSAFTQGSPLGSSDPLCAGDTSLRSQDSVLSFLLGPCGMGSLRTVGTQMV